MADLPTTLQLLKCTTARHKNADPVRRRRQRALQTTVLPGLSCLLSFLPSDLLPYPGERDQPSDHPTVDPIIPQRISLVKCPLGIFSPPSRQRCTYYHSSCFLSTPLFQESQQIPGIWFSAPLPVSVLQPEWTFPQYLSNTSPVSLKLYV